MLYTLIIDSATLKINVVETQGIELKDDQDGTIMDSLSPRRGKAVALKFPSVETNFLHVIQRMISEELRSCDW